MSIKQARQLRKKTQLSEDAAAWRDNSAENTTAEAATTAKAPPRKAATKAKAAAAKEARVSFSVEPGLRKRAKILFSLNEETFAGYLEECLERYVQKHRNLLPDSLK